MEGIGPRHRCGVAPVAHVHGVGNDPFGRRDQPASLPHGARGATVLAGGHAAAGSRAVSRAQHHAFEITSQDDIDNAGDRVRARSEEHTSEIQSLMRISYAVFGLKKKTNHTHYQTKYKTDNEKETRLTNI